MALKLAAVFSTTNHCDMEAPSSARSNPGQCHFTLTLTLVILVTLVTLMTLVTLTLVSVILL